MAQLSFFSGRLSSRAASLVSAIARRPALLRARFALGRAATLGLVAVCFLLHGAARASEIPVNGVLLRVNDRIATELDFEQRLEAAREMLARAEGMSAEERAERLRELPPNVMRGLFDELLLLSRADQLGMTVSDFDLDDMMRSRMKQFGLENDEQFQQALAQSGMTLEGFRNNLRDQRLQGEVAGRELWSRVTLEEDELRRVYKERQEEFRVPEHRTVREIVVLEETAGSAEQARESAVALAAAWRDGGEPQELATQAGGLFVDIGRVVEGDLAQSLRDAAWSLGLSEVGEPVAARGGWHVLQVTLVEPSTIPSFEEVRERLLRDERSRRVNDEQDVYLKELESKAYFEFSRQLPPELKDFRTANGRSLDEGGLRLIDGFQPQAAAGTELGSAEPESNEEPPPR